MLILFIIWGLITATALIFSKENDALWRKIFSVEVNEGLRTIVFYISFSLLVLLLAVSFYFFTFGNTFILIGTTLIWSLFVKVIVSVATKSP